VVHKLLSSSIKNYQLVHFNNSFSVIFKAYSIGKTFEAENQRANSKQFWFLPPIKYFI
jgi:hypothetical protein